MEVLEDDEENEEGDDVLLGGCVDGGLEGCEQRLPVAAKVRSIPC